MDEPSPGAAPPPAAVVGELLQVLPRLVERTRSQAEIARALVAALPCVGRMAGAGGGGPESEEDVAPGAPEHERLDVLAVLADDGAREHSTAEGPTPSPAGATRLSVVRDAELPEEPTPAESELPIQDYDSLAASQVVPRLATLSADDLAIVQRYEQAGRHRQTILHRVAQLLAD
jgi:hypothetical protein